jgi:hypothetical protein
MECQYIGFFIMNESALHKISADKSEHLQELVLSIYVVWVRFWMLYVNCSSFKIMQNIQILIAVIIKGVFIVVEHRMKFTW